MLLHWSVPHSFNNLSWRYYMYISIYFMYISIWRFSSFFWWLYSIPLYSYSIIYINGFLLMEYLMLLQIWLQWITLYIERNVLELNCENVLKCGGCLTLSIYWKPLNCVWKLNFMTFDFVSQFCLQLKGVKKNYSKEDRAYLNLFPLK